MVFLVDLELHRRPSLQNPEYVAVHEKADSSTPTTLVQRYMVCDLDQKLDLLFSFIRTHLKCKVIVFLSSCKQVGQIFETAFIFILSYAYSILGSLCARDFLQVAARHPPDVLAWKAKAAKANGHLRPILPEKGSRTFCDRRCCKVGTRSLTKCELG